MLAEGKAFEVIETVVLCCTAIDVITGGGDDGISLTRWQCLSAEVA